MKDKFGELEKVHKLLAELNMEYLMAPLTVGQTVLQMVNDLHQDKEQFGAQSTLPSPDGEYNFVIRVFREGDMLVATKEVENDTEI